MFNGYGVLALDSDHLDLSYRNPEAWPNLTPQGSIKSFTFELGDPDVGPVVQMGLITTREDEPLDWAHSIDPPHFHGSDQFRVISGGQWHLADKTMAAGSYAFQESGLRYSEHPGDGGAAWILLVVGDRRGIRPTILRDADRQKLINTGNTNDKPLDGEDPYPHPAGPRGTAAIATTLGPCERGYLMGTFADLATLAVGENAAAENTAADNTAAESTAVVTGVFGHPDAGPAVHIIKSASDCLVSPASTSDSERLLLVSGGSCTVGDREYRSGDIRIQRAGATMPALVSGPDGLDAAWVIADRRAGPVVAEGEIAWRHHTALVVQQLGG